MWSFWIFDHCGAGAVSSGSSGSSGEGSGDTYEHRKLTGCQAEFPDSRHDVT